MDFEAGTLILTLLAISMGVGGILAVITHWWLYRK